MSAWLRPALSRYRLRRALDSDMAIRIFDHAVIHKGVWYAPNTPIDFWNEDIRSEDTVKATPVKSAGDAEKKSAPRKKREV